MNEVPTLYTWAGGSSQLRRMLDVFYAKVPGDPLIGPLFAAMSPDHVAHVAAFVAEVFGGPTSYSEELGGHAAMIRHHVGRRISEAQRKRWMALLLESADEVGIPTDPEFRSALVGYLEWGTRLAVINSAADVSVTENAPMPRWGWGETKGPYLEPLPPAAPEARTGSNQTTLSRWLSVPRLEVIPPGRALSSSGPVAVPGSKSITNRALLVASLAVGRSTLRGTLESDDTRHMTTALRAMGVRIEKAGDGTTVHVDATGALRAPGAPLMLGNAGTATRFLTAAAALADGEVVLDGDEHMRKRPILPLVTALAQLGIDARTETGCPPVRVRGRGGFPGTRVEVDANLSSQYVSALLMLAARGREAVEVAFRGAEGGIIGARGYVDLTLSTMRAFGASVAEAGDGRWRVEPTGYQATDYAVEPDASSCTYLWAIEALTGSRFEYQVPPEALTQPDAKALAVIRTFPHMPRVIDGAQMQDAVPTLAVLAALNETPVRFVGVANLRVKECDRLRALATELSRVKPGLAVEEGDDLVVNGDPSLAGAQAPAVIDTYSDHRIAMSFSLLGLKVHGIVIEDPGCVSKTFPGYWDVLTALGVELRAVASR